MLEMSQSKNERVSNKQQYMECAAIFQNDEEIQWLHN